MNTIQFLKNKYLLKYKSRSSVLGVAVFGSVVRGTFDQYSDIDFYVLMKQQPKFSREGYIVHGVHIDVILDGKKEAYAFLRTETRSVRRPFSHMLAHSEILHDSKREMNTLVKRAKANLKSRTACSKSEYLMHVYSLHDFYNEVLRFSKTSNVMALKVNSELLVNNMIELFLKLHGEYFRRPNEMGAVLQQHDKRFALLLEKYYQSNNKKELLLAIDRLFHYFSMKEKTKLPSTWRA